MILDEILKNEINAGEIEGLVTSSPIIDIQSVVDYVSLEKGLLHLNVFKDFPNLAPPWRRATFIMRLPRKVMTDQGVMEFRSGGGLGAMGILASDRYGDHGWGVTITFYVAAPGSSRKGNTWVSRAFLWVNNDGSVQESTPWAPTLREVGDGVASFRGSEPTPPGDDDDKRSGYVMILNPEVTASVSFSGLKTVNFMVLFPTLMAICLCHCKNVSTQEVRLDERLVKARRRRGKAGFTKYHVLKIEAMRKAMREEAGEGTGIKQALHICRGHFKTYRDGNALFGKYTGTYWWEQHARGSKKYGEVVKSYQVEKGGSS